MHRLLALLAPFLMVFSAVAADHPATAAASQPAPAAGGYLFVTFKSPETPESEQIHFALSTDGFDWKALNKGNPVLTTSIGERGANAPFLLRTRENKFIVLATDLSIYYNKNWTRASHAGSKSLLLWESDDLVKWSEARLVKLAPDDAGCLWAPEAIYDEQARDYLVHWHSTSAADKFARQRFWASHTKDFKTFTKPFVYLQRNAHIVDLNIVHANNHYYRFYKDDESKSLIMETADALNLPWRRVTTFALANTPGYERPECFPLGGDTWCLYTDFSPTNQGYRAFTTTNLAKGEFSLEHTLKLPFPFRQGSILPLSADEYARVKAAYAPSPATQPTATPAAPPAQTQPAALPPPGTQPAPPADSQPSPAATTEPAPAATQRALGIVPLTDQKSGLSLRIPRDWLVKKGIDDTGFEAPIKDRDDHGAAAPNVVLSSESNAELKPADLPAIIEAKRKQFPRFFADFKEIGIRNLTLDGQPAMVFECTTVVQKVVRYHVQQYWVIADGKIYTITFGSLDAAWKKNAPTFDAIVQSVTLPRQP